VERSGEDGREAGTRGKGARTADEAATALA